MKSQRRNVKLDDVISDGDGKGKTTFKDLIEYAEKGRTDDHLMYESAKTDIDRVLKILPPRNREVLVCYYGIRKGETMTLEEIGSEMGLTRERVRQIRNKSLETLRKHSAGGLLREYLN